MFIGGYGACRSPRCDVQFSGLAFSGRPESNRRRPAWEFSAGPSRTLTPSHSSSLSRPPARDASHDFSPLLTRDGQYLGQYGLPEPVSRCPTVTADPGRARSAQRPRLGRCPRNFGAPGSRSRPQSPAEPAAWPSPHLKALRCQVVIFVPTFLLVPFRDALARSGFT